MWWAEFQKRGAIHYHMILVDAPFATEGEARRWLTDHWRAQLPQGVFRTQPDVRFRSSSWFRKAGGNYILKDVRKLHGKRYEQDYSRMPRGWRTFRSHQLTFAAAEHQLHESKAWTQCTSAPDASFAQKQHDIWIYRIDRHVPGPDGCRLYQRRNRSRKLADTTSRPVSDSLVKCVPVANAENTGAAGYAPGSVVWSQDHYRHVKAPPGLEPVVSNTGSDVA